MGIQDVLKGPAALVKGGAEFLVDTVEAVGSAVAKEAPALKGPAVEALQQIVRTSTTAVQSRVARLDAPSGDERVTESIAADPTLTDHQRRVLLSLYAAFQEENAAGAEYET